MTMTPEKLNDLVADALAKVSDLGTVGAMKWLANHALAERALAPQGQAHANPYRATFPQRVWLNVGDCNETELAEFSSHHEITWADSQIDQFDIEYVRADLASQLALPAGPVPEPTSPDIRPDTVMAKPMPVNALWGAIGVYCEAVIDDELAACGIGDKVDPRMRIGAAKRLIGLIGDRTDHDEPAYPANRLHKDAHRTPAVAQPVDGFKTQPTAEQVATVRERLEAAGLQKVAQPVADEREALKQALRDLRAAFVVAVGDKSPFAKIALGKVDDALGQPAEEGGKA
ncbi:hypothetical protein FEE59_13560 [Herbaspirillum sp. RU 5E]|nr:hypothetical protein [Herbaspirillum sp. RU 5E]